MISTAGCLLLYVWEWSQQRDHARLNSKTLENIRNQTDEIMKALRQSSAEQQPMPWVMWNSTGLFQLAGTCRKRLTEERYNTDVDIGIGNVDRTDTTSPYYNKLNQYHNGGQSYGIDEPDARFSTSPNSIPNSQAQNRLSGYFSTLPRASVGSGPTYPDSMVSSKNFPVSPPGTLKGADPTISFSTPAINDRYSSDVDTLQKSTSYMTDV